MLFARNDDGVCRGRSHSTLVCRRIVFRPIARIGRTPRAEARAVVRTGPVVATAYRRFRGAALVTAGGKLNSSLPGRRGISRGTAANGTRAH